MNRCPICQGMGVHATFCPQHPTFSARFGRFTTPPPQPDPWPDLESRPDEGLFEGMSRAGLCQLAEMRVGESLTIQGREVWRWEESSPVTQILSNGRPRGRVELSEEWMRTTPDLGGAESPLRAAVLRWRGAGRTWYREDVLGRWATLVAWETEPEDPHVGTELTHYAGEPLA